GRAAPDPAADGDRRAVRGHLGRLRAARRAGHRGQGPGQGRAGRHRAAGRRWRLQVPVHWRLRRHSGRGRGQARRTALGMMAFDTVFDEATAVTRCSEGLYTARPDARFALVAPGGNAPPAVNGGALIATVLRAVLQESPSPHPVATTANFLRVARLEPAQIRVTWLKRGKTAATARACLEQGGETVLDMSVTTGRVPPSTGSDQDLAWTGTPPDIPPIEDCVELGPNVRRRPGPGQDLVRARARRHPPGG